MLRIQRSKISSTHIKTRKGRLESKSQALLLYFQEVTHKAVREYGEVTRISCTVRKYKLFLRIIPFSHNMKDNLYITGEVNRIIVLAREEAERLGNESILPDHIFLAILRDGNNRAYWILKSFNIKLTAIKKELDDIHKVVPSPAYNEDIPLPASVEAQNILGKMISEAKKDNAGRVDSYHLLCAILYNGTGHIGEILQKHGIGIDDIINNARRKEDNPFNERIQERETGKESRTRSLLYDFGTDLTLKAEKGELDPIIGRDEEIERLIQILGRRKKNNPLLIGDAGVGKSAIVEGLAERITDRRVPENFLYKRVISLDLPSIIAGTKFRGEFEERLKNIIDELSERNDIILFIDEIHTIVGAGSASGSMDAANMLKPALANGSIQCIGATTTEKFRKSLEKDAALERRFQKVTIEQTDYDSTLKILYGIKDRYQEYHGVYYDDQAISACITLTERYVNGRSLPDKAIDAMDESGSMLHLLNSGGDPKTLKSYRRLAEIKTAKQKAAQEGSFIEAAELFLQEQKINRQISSRNRTGYGFKEKPRVTKDLVAKVVAEMSGVPVEKIAESEAEKLSTLADRIKKRIVGQDEAVESVVDAIKRNRSGIRAPERPIGTFIFFGPTGVGKTELAKTVAEELFGSKNSLIRIDMGEFSEKFTSSRLIGAPPGYVGYDAGGELSEKVRKRPYSVVLLDEIEKAHPDIFNMLLQVMDEGRLTDSNGRNIDFRNCIIIMTSNAGSREMQEYGEGMGYAVAKGREQDMARKNIAEKVIKHIFPPEFLNRIDDQIHFNSLTRDDILKIVNIELSGLKKRVKEAGFVLAISEGAKDQIAKEGYSSKYGARPLKRAIQRLVETPVADAIINLRPTHCDSALKTINIRLSRKSGSEQKLEIEY